MEVLHKQLGTWKRQGWPHPHPHPSLHPPRSSLGPFSSSSSFQNYPNTR